MQLIGHGLFTVLVKRAAVSSISVFALCCLLFAGEVGYGDIVKSPALWESLDATRLHMTVANSLAEGAVFACSIEAGS